jgi:predicted ATP-dependent protease
MCADLANSGGLELSADRLRRRCDPNGITLVERAGSFEHFIGQRRAQDALALGLAIDEAGFNVYAAGPPRTGKTTAVCGFLNAAARQRPTPGDWCYVHNFRDPTHPRALRLSPGQGRLLREKLLHLVQAARQEIPRAFESEEYVARREGIINALARRRQEGLGELVARAQSRGFRIEPTPMGFALAPVMGNRPLSDEDVAGLRPEMRETISRNREQIEAEVGTFLKEVRAAERETRERLEAQDRQLALHAVGGLVDDLLDDYPEQPEVTAYLMEIREGILADIGLFRSHPLSDDPASPQPPGDDPRHVGHERAFRKYEVNVVIDNGSTSGAPVVLESNPTYPNLIGRIEREAVLGALVTDFTLISPGALHRANGGYLMVRAEDLLRAPLAWDALKRALREGELDVEDVSEVTGLTSTRGLQPEPIPLDVKVFLLGHPSLYYLLYGLDPDFRELFKVRADFSTEMERTPETEAALAAFACACAAQRGRPLDQSGAARLIEESSRLVADQRKLSARFGELTDLVREADHWAASDQSPSIGADHVRRAVEQRIYRSGLMHERLNELFSRGVLLVQLTGTAVGQINGLAVIAAGDIAFGRPSRITATTGAGREGLLDIERQAELGGPIHSKGVLILNGYLTERYAQDKPLSLSARLVFEQSYEEVEGDSASLAELLSLLSRLADAPLRQGIAVTGSVNQNGEVQAIGGVNEKIEGFFAACQSAGASDDQGVMIPAANVDNLMLRDDVVEAVATGQFHLYAVEHVDQALEILTSQSPADIHQRVDARLRSYSEALRRVDALLPEANHRGRARRQAGARRDGP